MTRPVAHLPAGPSPAFGRLVLRTAAIAGLAPLLLVSGCGATSGGPTGAVPAPAPPAVSADDARSRLLDSWVADGSRGFFVDNAHSAMTPAFSLYRTFWYLRLAERSGQGKAGLAPASVRTWTEAALDGTAQDSGLPTIALLDHGVRTLRLVGAPVDPSRVGRTLDRLRRGGQYLSSTAAKGPDWGSTAVAVGLQAELGLPVPAEVVTATVAAVTAAATSQNRPAADGSDLGRAVSLLQIVAALGGRLPEQVPMPPLAGLANAAQAMLARAAPDAAWLSAQASLRRAAARLGVRLAPLPPDSCAGLVRADGGVGLPGQQSADPQATFYAVELGCRGARVAAAPPHSRAGWPTPQAVEGAPATSVSALRVAREVGVGGRFSKPLERQVRDVWLPALRRGSPPRTTAWQVDVVNMKMLASAIGGPLRTEVGAALQVPAIGRDGRDDAGLLLGLLDLAYSPRSPQRLAEARTAAVAAAALPHPDRSMLRAAWLALAADVLDAPALRASAMSEAQALRRSPGLYAAAKPSRTGSGPTSSGIAHASLGASTIGAWIERPGSDILAAWTAAGLCAADRCAENAADLAHTDQMSMRTLATVLACQRRAYREIFPTAV